MKNFVLMITISLFTSNVAFAQLNTDRSKKLPKVPHIFREFHVDPASKVVKKPVQKRDLEVQALTERLKIVERELARKNEALKNDFVRVQTFGVDRYPMIRPDATFHSARFLDYMPDAARLYGVSAAKVQADSHWYFFNRREFDKQVENERLNNLYRNLYEDSKVIKMMPSKKVKNR